MIKTFVNIETQEVSEFVFNEETHTGTLDGVVIPSITQLLSIEYPMSDIPQDRLDKASEYGSSVHQDIECYNNGLSDEFDTKEGHNYKLLLDKFGLKVKSCEKTIFIKDRKGKIVAFGTYDALLESIKDTCFAKVGDIILVDFKTVSQFDNEKVEKQLNMYALGSEDEITKLAGIWLREDIMQIRPLKLKDYDETYDYVMGLVKKWREQNGVH